MLYTSRYRKISKISPRTYIFQRPFFGGAYIRREICVLKLIELVYSGKEIHHFCFVLLCIWGQIPSTSPPGGLYSEGQFNGGFFASWFWGGLYMEGLIFRILRYFKMWKWLYICEKGPSWGGVLRDDPIKTAVRKNNWKEKHCSIIRHFCWLPTSKSNVDSDVKGNWKLVPYLIPVPNRKKIQ